jgi:hypothetical protein
LYRRFHRHGRWEQEPCEFAVELRQGDDPADAGAWNQFPADPADTAAHDAYWAALLEDKVSGTLVPTPFGPRFEADFVGWRLVLQLHAKDNADETGPFFLNLAYDAVSYAFLSPNGRSGKFLWAR